MKTLTNWILTASLTLSVMACSGKPAYVRGSDNPDLDSYAMSTGLDKVDLEKLFDQNAAGLLGPESGVKKRWQKRFDADNEARVAIFPVTNETSEHVDSQLQALLSKFETKLVNAGMVTVISREKQKTILIEELKEQRSAVYNPDKAAQFGKLLGVDYYVTGKLYNSAEKSGSERRVQYFLFMQAIEVETGAIRWQNEANLTKGLIK